MILKVRMNTVLTPILLLLVQSVAGTGKLARPIGTSRTQAASYVPRDDGSWVCLDNSNQIKFQHINDDYCDCPDGSDEPGTAACSLGTFHCVNLGYRSKDIPSSRVNDGICDCCDASDEYGTKKCVNTCKELGRAEDEQRKTEAELFKRGAVKRTEMIARGKQLQVERESRRVELETRRSETEAIKLEKEKIKQEVEELEAAALELFKMQEAEKKQAEEEPQAMRREAEVHFVRFDTNEDGFVEVNELQMDISLDRDRNGEVSIEEAKYFLDERERIDLDEFVALSWPRIKPIKMLAEGLFKPPVLDGAEVHSDGEHVNVQPPAVENEEDYAEGDGESENAEAEYDAEEEDVYEDEETEEADVGVGTVTETSTPTPVYDETTQGLVNSANEARNAYAEVERMINEIDHEIKEIDNQNAKDYGSSQEFAVLDGECYTLEDREYVYTLCPFDRTSQKPRNGGSETTLGRWDQWISEGDNKYAKQKYAHGASCWNGPNRSVVVVLKCALEEKLTTVTEPNRCEYFFEFETPAACDYAAFDANLANAHDEL